MEPQSLWELSLPNGPFELEGKAISANTKEALLDGNYETGVTCAAPGVIVATFPVPTLVSTINVASFHADPSVWGSAKLDLRSPAMGGCPSHRQRPAARTGCGGTWYVTRPRYA